MPRQRKTLEDFLEEGGHTKESRPYLITDSAFFTYKAVAVKRRFGGNIGAFMEQLAKELSEKELTAAERAHVKKLADEETQKRRDRRIEKAKLTAEGGQAANDGE